MQCLFLKRKYPEPIPPTLSTLFQKMSVIRTVGRNASSSTTVYFTSSQIPATGIYYIFSVFNGYVGIWKLVNGTVVATPIKKQSASYGGLYYNTNTNNLFYYSGGYGSGTSSATGVRGCTLAMVQFPTFSDTTVDQILGAITLSRLAYRNTNTPSAVSTNNTSKDFILATKDTAFDIRDGSTWEKIAGTESDAASISGSNLTLGSVYGGSIIGIVES